MSTKSQTVRPATATRLKLIGGARGPLKSFRKPVAIIPTTQPRGQQKGQIFWGKNRSLDAGSRNRFGKWDKDVPRPTYRGLSTKKYARLENGQIVRRNS